MWPLFAACIVLQGVLAPRERRTACADYLGGSGPLAHFHVDTLRSVPGPRTLRAPQDSYHSAITSGGILAVAALVSQPVFFAHSSLPWSPQGSKPQGEKYTKALWPQGARPLRGFGGFRPS